MCCFLAEVDRRASVTSTNAPNRVLDASVCRTNARTDHRGGGGGLAGLAVLCLDVREADERLGLSRLPVGNPVAAGDQWNMRPLSVH